MPHHNNTLDLIRVIKLLASVLDRKLSVALYTCVFICPHCGKNTSSCTCVRSKIAVSKTATTHIHVMPRVRISPSLCHRIYGTLMLTHPGTTGHMLNVVNGIQITLCACALYDVCCVSVRVTHLHKLCAGSLPTTSLLVYPFNNISMTS